jgi:hypothetical protein
MPPLTYLPVVPNRWSYAQCTADEPYTGDTAQHASASLTVAVDAGRTYLVDAGVVFACTSAAATVSLGWTGPAGAAMQWNNTTGSTGYRAGIGLTDTYTGSTASRLAFLRGRLVVGTAAGALTLTVGVSDALQTVTLQSGSWLYLTRVI